MTPDSPAPSRATVLDCFAWAVRHGAAFAPNGTAGVLVLTPHLAGVPDPRPFSVPDPVRQTLVTDADTVRTLLDVARATLAQPDRDYPPASRLDGPHGAAFLTVCAWAEIRHATYTLPERVAWTRAMQGHRRRGVPRWLAAVMAAEDLEFAAQAPSVTAGAGVAALRAAA